MHPDPARCVVHALGQTKDDGGGQAPSPVKEFGKAQRHDEHEEEVQEIPRTHPRAAHAIDAASAQHRPARWGVERGAQALHIVLPADNVEFRDAIGDANIGGDIEGGIAKLDALTALFIAARNKQVGAALGGAPELGAAAVVESPTSVHRAAEVVARGRALTIEIEPDLALKLQEVR